MRQARRAGNGISVTSILEAAPVPLFIPPTRRGTPTQRAHVELILSDARLLDPILPQSGRAPAATDLLRAWANLLGEQRAAWTIKYLDPDGPLSDRQVALSLRVTQSVAQRRVYLATHSLRLWVQSGLYGLDPELLIAAERQGMMTPDDIYRRLSGQILASRYWTPDRVEALDQALQAARLATASSRLADEARRALHRTRHRR